jgi:hypothetical protein
MVKRVEELGILEMSNKSVVNMEYGYLATVCKSFDYLEIPNANFEDDLVECNSYVEQDEELFDRNTVMRESSESLKIEEDPIFKIRQIRTPYNDGDDFHFGNQDEAILNDL